MNLKHLSNSELLKNTFTLAANERKISTQILYHLAEVETRKAYAAKYKCRSLREYAIQILKYSEGSVDRRIAAMYALRKNPEFAEKIEAGDMNVTNVARVETFIRKEERRTNEAMPAEQKESIFQQLENTSSRKLESLLMEISPEAAVREGNRPVAKDLHEVRLYLSSEELQKFETLQGWLAHGFKNAGSHSELLVKLIAIAEKQILKEKTTEPVRAKRTESNAKIHIAIQTPNNAQQIQSEAPPLTGESRTRYIPARVEREVYRRSCMRCEWKNPFTQERCGSAFKPEIHHQVNFAQGGNNTAGNLLLFCAEHNQTKAYEDYGFQKMNAAVHA